MSYAEDTHVPVSQTKQEVERMLKGAGARQFYVGELDDGDVIGARLGERLVRFKVIRPDHAWAKAQRKKTPNLDNLVAKEYRRRWRCLGLLIKAKLAAVAGNVRSMEEEFLADVVMPDNRTLYESVVAGLASAYENGKVRGPLLLGPAGLNKDKED